MATETQSIDQFKGKPRLPKFAIPTSYEISLAPELVSCKFTGYVRIAVDVVSDTRFLVLNAADLQIDNGSVCFESQSSGKALQPSEVVLVEADEIAVFGFSEALPVGKGVLSIKFDGTLNDQMKGFYRSTYEHNGEKKNMAVTQFEPTDARRCFPCWDEPALKSTFKITLEVPSELVALSNMPVKEEKINGSIKALTYEESPIMSTYLVAFVVGLFDYVEARSTDGTKVRVYCQVGKASQGKLALDVAVKTLDIYRSYFEVPYPLPKLDMVAIPDFSAGAMENYGLVTYRETALLYDEQHSAAANKQRVAVVVAHELAHQWFGNLVTMEWWTHLWLNEGFATWVSYLAADSIFPEWNIWTQFLDDFTMGLRLDALSESHPIEVDINHASEIDEIFDAISYRKGASMIRMLHNYLGADCFQKALASYVKKFAYANAKTEDLWDVLEEESGEPVKTLMDSWTKQKGYPVVSVKLEEGKLLFEQTQFLSSGLSGDGQWIVPITLCCCSYSSQKKFLFKTKSEKLDMAEIVNSSIAESGLVAKGNQQRGGYFWIKFNVDQTGFYRVKYDDELANGLRYAIEANQLSAMDRFGILDDAFAICKTGKQTLSSLLSLMVAYREETDYTVLSLLISICCKIVNVAADAVPELLDDVKLYFVNLLQFSADRVGWDAKEGEGHLDMMLRSELLVALVYLGHDITQNEALRRFSLFINDRNTPLLPPDTRKAAYVAVMQTVNNSDKSGYENLLKVYRETDLSQEKTRILSSIASSPDPEVVRDALNFLLSPEVRNQDVIFGLAGVSKEGRDVAWTWLKDNWEYIKKTLGSGFLLGRFISSIVSRFCSEEKAKEVEEYFASRITPAISRNFKQSIERIGINTKWVQSMKSESNLGAAVKELAYRKY